METSELNPASDLFQWEPNGEKKRSAGIHINIDSKNNGLGGGLNKWDPAGDATLLSKTNTVFTANSLSSLVSRYVKKIS